MSSWLSSAPSSNKSDIPLASQPIHSSSQESQSSDVASQDPRDESLRLRKEYLLYTISAFDRSALQRQVDRILAVLGPQSTDHDECWFYQSPPASRHGSIYIKACFRDLRGSDNKDLYLQIGTAMLVLNKKLTPKEKHGYVNCRWELSHLCGNWKCCNNSHHVQEPKKTNLERRVCHRTNQACYHEPRCIRGRQPRHAIETGQRKLMSLGSGWGKISKINDNGTAVSNQVSTPPSKALEKVRAIDSSAYQDDGSWSSSLPISSPPILNNGDHHEELHVDTKAPVDDSKIPDKKRHRDEEERQIDESRKRPKHIRTSSRDRSERSTSRTGDEKEAKSKLQLTPPVRDNTPPRGGCHVQ